MPLTRPLQRELKAAKRATTSAGPGGAPPAAAKKKNRRGKSSSRLFLTKRPRGGAAITDAAGDVWIARDARLLNKWLQKAGRFQSSGYSLDKDGSHAASGWQGRRPPPKDHSQIRKDYASGAIGVTLATFFLVPYTECVPYAPSHPR